MQARREARQDDGRLAAAGGADQRRQTLPADRLRQPGNGRVATEEQLRVVRAEIGQPRIGAGRNRLAAIGCRAGSSTRAVVDREILDDDRAGTGDALDLAAGDGRRQLVVRHREYPLRRAKLLGGAPKFIEPICHVLGACNALHDATAHVELDFRHRLAADAVRLHLLDQLAQRLQPPRHPRSP